jgi:hypothetical protein
MVFYQVFFFFVSLCIWLYVLCSFVKFCKLFILFHICTGQLDIIKASYLTTVFNSFHSFMFFWSFLYHCVYGCMFCVVLLNSVSNFVVRHPHCVSNKSNVMCTQYVVKHNLVLDGMLVY